MGVDAPLSLCLDQVEVARVRLQLSFRYSDERDRIARHIRNHSSVGSICRVTEDIAHVSEHRLVELDSVVCKVEVRDCVYAEMRPEEENIRPTAAG